MTAEFTAEEEARLSPYFTNLDRSTFGLKLPQEVAGAKEDYLINESTLKEIFGHLDELSSHWSRLAVGQSITVRWPDLNLLTEDNE